MNNANDPLKNNAGKILTAAGKEKTQSNHNPTSRDQELEKESHKRTKENIHHDLTSGGWGLEDGHHKRTKGDTNYNSTKNRLSGNRLIGSTLKQTIYLSALISLFSLSLLLTLTSTASALPSISINSPNHVTPQRAPLLNITTDSAGTIWYSLDSGANITIATGENTIAQNISLIPNSGFETTKEINNKSAPIHWQFYNSERPIDWNTDSYTLTDNTSFGKNALKFTYDANDSNDDFINSMFIETGKKTFDIEFYVKPNMTFESGDAGHGYCIDLITSEGNFSTIKDEFILCLNNTQVWSLDELATSGITNYSRTDIGNNWLKINFTTPEISENATFITIALFPAIDDTTYTGDITLDEISILLDHGPHTLDIWANDTEGTSHKEAPFTISDHKPPKITLISPENNTDILKGTIIKLNITSPGAITNATCTIDEKTTKIPGPPYKLNTSTWPSGPVTLEITAGDSNNLTTIETFHFPHVYAQYPKNTYFQKSWSITTGKPFHLAYQLTINSTETNTTTLDLWGIYDTDNDGKLDDEYIIQSTETIAINAIDTSSYPPRLTFELPETELSLLIAWNTTIDPINFDLNRWATPLHTEDGSWMFSSEKEYHFILPTNFSINYTNIHVIWPYTSDGAITAVSPRMPAFEITQNGIETTFEKIQGQNGIFSGKGQHKGKTRFDDAFIHLTNTTTRLIAQTPFVKHFPNNLKIEDEYSRTSSITLNTENKKASIYNFYSYGPLNSEASEWTVFDRTSKQHNIPLQIEGIHIETKNSFIDAIHPKGFYAKIGFKETETHIGTTDYFTHTAQLYAQNITTTIKRAITINENHIKLTYTLTNNAKESKDYVIWLTDLTGMLKNDNLNSQYIFYDNKNTTKETSFEQQKTRCIGLMEHQMHQSALYCPLQPYTFYIKNTDITQKTFPLPPYTDPTTELIYEPYLTTPSISLKFSPKNLEPGESATISTHIFTSVSSETEAGAETFDNAILRMKENEIEKTRLKDSGKAEVIYKNSIIEELDISITSDNQQSNTRTITIINNGFWNYIIDETNLLLDTHRVISDIEYNGQTLTSERFACNDGTGTLDLYSLETTAGANTLKINYIPSDPQWSGMTESPESPVEWKTYTEYTFTIDWTDDYGIESTAFELDNKTYNSTITRSGSTYTYKTTGLACGEHTYSWRAKDTDNNSVTTQKRTYTITCDNTGNEDDNDPAEPTATTSAGTTQTYSDETTATGTEPEQPQTTDIQDITAQDTQTGNETTDNTGHTNTTQPLYTNSTDETETSTLSKTTGLFTRFASASPFSAPFMILATLGLLIANSITGNKAGRGSGMVYPPGHRRNILYTTTKNRTGRSAGSILNRMQFIPKITIRKNRKYNTTLRKKNLLKIRNLTRGQT